MDNIEILLQAAQVHFTPLQIFLVSKYLFQEY